MSFGLKRRCYQSILALATTASSAAMAADTGAAAAQIYNRPGGTQKLEATESVQRVRIPIILESWNVVTTKNRNGNNEESRIAQKPISHVLRARIEKPNDFYVGDWRLQTTPIRWLKSTNQYQVRIELFRRYGETGQIEESLGEVNLTGILQRQDNNLYQIHGSARRKFNDRNGQPIASLEVGSEKNDDGAPAALSKSATSPTTQSR